MNEEKDKLAQEIEERRKDVAYWEAEVEKLEDELAEAISERSWVRRQLLKVEKLAEALSEHEQD